MRSDTAEGSNLAVLIVMSDSRAMTEDEFGIVYTKLELQIEQTACSWS